MPPPPGPRPNLGALLLRLFAAIALIAYPAFAWLGLSRGSPREVAIVLLLVMLPAFVMRVRKSHNQGVRGLVAVPITVVLVLSVSAALDHQGAMLMTPVATNVVLLLAFGSTLRPGSIPMIERFARLQEPELDAPKLAWCRLWTWLWCAFFVANGGTALLLALYAELRWWALYNGLLCYGAIAAMFAAEWLLRRALFPEARLPRRAHTASAVPDPGPNFAPNPKAPPPTAPPPAAPIPPATTRTER